jgi:hypothetical protein
MGSLLQCGGAFHFAWEVCFNGGLLCMVCIHHLRFFFLFLPLSTPTQKEENKTKEEKLTLLWALGCVDPFLFDI